MKHCVHKQQVHNKFDRNWLDGLLVDMKYIMLYINYDIKSAH